MSYKVEIRKNKDGFFEMHPSEPAVIVKYRVEAVVVRPDGTEVARGRKGATKLMHFTNLADATDLKRVAREAVSRCAYLDPTRIDELEQILAAIRTRQKMVQPGRPATAMRPATATSAVRRNKIEAKISDLPQYRALLYNSMEEKITGAEMILQLAQSKTYVAQIARSDPVINALARLLFEDESRNLDLKINICRIFAAMAQLSLAPALFAKNRIGGSLLQEIALELERYQTWKAGIAQRQNNPTELETFRKKFVQFLRKQDQFIGVALQILLVIGRDLVTQTKMVRKDIVLILSKCCERSNPEVQILSLRFLLRLSIFVDNLDKFAQAATMEKVARALDQQRNKDVCEYGVKLLYNLSLCPALRKTMLKKSFSRRILPLLEDSHFSELTARLLYSMSQDTNWRPASDLGATCARLLTQKSENQLGPGEYLIALTTNLMKDPTAADEFSSAVKMEEVMATSLKTADAPLLKIINLVTKNATEANWANKENTAAIVKCFTEGTTSDFFLECIIALATAVEKGYCTAEDLSRLCKLDLELITKCRELKQPSELLALVVFLGALASSEKGAQILTAASMTDWLCQKLEGLDDRQEEISLQIGYGLLQLTQYEPARLRIMDYPGITKVFSTRAQRSSDTGKALFEELLQHLSMVSEEIHEAWKTERFQQYNGQWLQAIATRHGDAGNDNHYIQDDYNDDEMDLVTRFGLDDLSDEMDDDEDDVEDMIERYSARTHSRLGFRS